MSRKKGGMSKRLRKQRASEVFEQRKQEKLTNMSEKELTNHINFLKGHIAKYSHIYSGFPHLKKEIDDALNELESRKKK